jgi:hypothetical protein
MDKTIANEILRQLGGNQFIAMTGARNFICDDNSIVFSISGIMTKDRINRIKITLNAMDTYTVEFYNIRNTTIKFIGIVGGVYNDTLQDVISNKTGLALSL